MLRWDLSISKGGDSTVLWRTCGSPTSQQKLKEITPHLSKQPAPGEVSPAQLNLQHSLSLGQLKGELPALPLPAQPQQEDNWLPTGQIPSLLAPVLLTKSEM